ncbi:MAG: universal stress protein [Campylobacterales bacterium]|nr:universal stress protein [Campylobacterales bacterium]
MPNREKCVLVATDFSPRSFEVITKAHAFATASKMPLHVVHAIEETFFNKIPDLEKAKQNAFDELHAHFPFITQDFFHCDKGKVEEVIGMYTNAFSTSVVFLGSGGEKGGLRDLFVGSSTKAIVRTLSAPVFVVKTHKNVEAKKILIPTDLTESSRWHIHAVQTLFPHASLLLLHVYTVPFGNRLSMYGVKKGEVNMLAENLKANAQNEAMLFLESLGEGKENVELLVREGGLDTALFTSVATMHGIQLIALHTTGNISFFAFDLLQETDKDVLITTV